MKDNNSAFPVFDSTHGEMDYECIDPGMSLRQYAAIRLMVPRSGDPELDAIIRESRRLDFAGRAMSGIAAKVYKVGNYKEPHVWGDIANEAFLLADAMIEEWEEKQGGEAK